MITVTLIINLLCLLILIIGFAISENVNTRDEMIVFFMVIILTIMNSISLAIHLV